MEYVRQHTSIPIPRAYHNHFSWLIMDRVDGQMLYECWNEQSAFMKFRIACTLRLYVNQLRSITSERAGGITDGMIGGVVFDHVERGPFDSVRRFRRFCELVSFVGWKTAYERKHRKIHAMHSRPPLSDGPGLSSSLTATSMQQTSCWTRTTCCGS
ncbi:uncharacterized protein LAESUDRAFT_732244 [Laetiporus sulphureus 93-53]|uniref:Uncharacterized protein n=1 Tax=Laetiporus sulphureus 93-53 TaxID=1314785 RepID=A0A165B8W8_9APHY|nr:uncharacterized protein LAESUDRAFT_732244 [Laetiporus sulphureus 93-53]KZT00512.1 hypothetical protein LAESUDRAFT_732244 [Laetiporus sulphureus 93-53]